MEAMKEEKGQLSTASINSLHKNTSSLKDDQENIQYGSINKDDEALILKSVDKKAGHWSRYKSLTIEPFMLAFMFAYFLNRSCLTNMIMDKGCLYNLNFTKEVCSNLSGHSTEKEKVEIVANNYNLYANLMQLLGAFQMMFIAPWSDKYGRKFPLIVAVVGMILNDFSLMLCSIYFDSALYYIIISRIPGEFFGGFICTLTIVYSHASEVSSLKTRALKYAFVEIAMGLGMTFGSLTGGLMYTYGYVYTFLVAGVVHFLCIPWVIFFVKETKGLENCDSWRNKMADFFVLENIMKGWKATMRKRENNGRALMLSFFASMCIMILTLESMDSMGFVFIHHLYNWDQGKYSTINTYFVATQMMFLCIIMPILYRKFRVSDSVLGITGIISMMGKFCLIGFSQLSIYLFYIGNIAGTMYGVAMFVVRSIISKIVDKDEFGQVFSFLATCEAIFPMFGTVLITKLFNATMDTFPNVSYMVTVVLLTVPLINFVWLYVRTRGISSQPISPT